MDAFRQQFLTFCVERNILRFGDFITKAGRASPYFFNAGLVNDGAALAALAQFYVKAIESAGLEFDMLFGPAYKGIPLASAIAMTYAAQGRTLAFAFNRKEAKQHGEGGKLIGAPLRGKVLIVDDVISAGTSVRESVELIREAGATPCGVAIALDRCERGQAALSATQEVTRDYGMPVISVAKLDDLIEYLAHDPALRTYRTAIDAYRSEYGVEVEHD